MGFLDFFGRKDSAGNLAKHAKRAADKKAQNPDRWASLEALGKMHTPEAVYALLQRFTIRVTPSITDQDEKELAKQGVLGSGEVAVAPLKKFLNETDSIAWPVRMLSELVDEEELVGTLVEFLGEMTTEYERDPQRKIDAIAQLEERKDERIAPAVIRFLADVNEAARFHAAATLLVQENAEVGREAALKVLGDEESVRVRVSILDGFIHQGWGLGENAKEYAPHLPSGYSLDGDSIKKTR
ncbi:MAG: HEAT repeat domain-containing protein [Polyangiales bacterium]